MIDCIHEAGRKQFLFTYGILCRDQLDRDQLETWLTEFAKQVQNNSCLTILCRDRLTVLFHPLTSAVSSYLSDAGSSNSISKRNEEKASNRFEEKTSYRYEEKASKRNDEKCRELLIPRDATTVVQVQPH